LLEKKDEVLKKEIVKILCNISSSEDGKRVLFQCNVVAHLNKILHYSADSFMTQTAVACLANIATCIEIKKRLAESGCLIHVLQALQQGIESSELELVKYCLYFIGNMCEDFTEAAYVLGSDNTNNAIYRTTLGNAANGSFL